MLLISIKDTSALALCLFFSHGFLMTLRPGYILQDFGGEDASCLSQEDFGKLRSGEEEASLKVGLKSWYVLLSWSKAGGRSG